MSNLLSMICSAAAMLAVSSNVFAQATTTSTSTTPAKKAAFFEQGSSLSDSSDRKYNPGYAAPAGAKVDSSMDINVNASFIYWYFAQDAMDIAHTVPTDTKGGAVVNQKFAYKPGFKVGIGYDTHFDNWAVNAEYTWFHARAKTAATGKHLEANSWFPQNINNLAHEQVVNSSWKLHMDLLDVVASRPFYQGTNITVSPAGGIRTLFLRQNVNVNLGKGEAISNNDSHSWAIGPKAGVNTKWMIWKGLRIDSVLGASVLYTRYTSLSNAESQMSVPQVTSTAKNISALRPTLDMGLGLGYGIYAMNNKLFFDVSARYDFAQYWSQNVSRTFASQLNGHSSAPGDLNMHGLTLNFRCDF